MKPNRYHFVLLTISLLFPALQAVHAEELAIVSEAGEALPIVVAPDASTETLRAARTLAGAIEKISGRRPPLHEQTPGPVPESAIWVGLQPEVVALFPEVDWTFSHPEEIFLLSDGQNIVLVGKDEFTGDIQTEFGTANAVYTFLEEGLDMRWLWPGPLGEDYAERDTIVIPAMEKRFHPVFRTRRIFHRPSDKLLEWLRLQRNVLDSLRFDPGHAFGDWWEMYHENHPEYFALQPDGTRSGFPGGGNAKLCETEPGVWNQWLANVDAALQEDPSRTIFNAAPNDASNAGICVCDRCLAWDDPDAPPVRLRWRGLTQEYVAMSDRYTKFWNQLGQMLRKTYPDQPLMVSGMAYGPAKLPPTSTRPDDNVLIGYVGHFPIGNEATRSREKSEWEGWGQLAETMVFRPNLFWYSGGWHGIPTLAVQNTIEDFQFLAENNCVGISVDHPPHHFAPLAPQHYAMVRLAWNPRQDGEAMMEEFYARGFGAAAAEVREYYELMEDAHMELLDQPEWRHSMGGIRWVATKLPEVYSPERIDQATMLLDNAAAKLEDAPEIQRQRLAFVRAGLDYTKQHLEILETMGKVRESGGTDRAAVERAVELCQQRDEFFEQVPDYAYRGHHFNVTWNRARRMQDYLGPPSDEFLRAAGLIEGEEEAAVDLPPPSTPEDKAAFQPVTAAEGGWKLVFEDDFDRDHLGDDWEIVEGAWTTEEGWLKSGGGVLRSNRRFPGYQRLEFEAVTHVEPFPFFGPETEAIVQYSDISSAIHANEDLLSSGYFLQFGGFNNTRNRLRRLGVVVDEETENLIVPDQIHHIVAESDEGRVRLIVDGNLLLSWQDPNPLLGSDHERIGFYMWTGAKVRNLRVYTKESP